ncbi:MAG: hypothetical protein WBM01_09610 [Mycobacterium sp.]|uniref:hypothetical protein n=1 Tax=Mycobacterium sp. TaxID=1785 RepID=UPI003C709693
MTMTLTRRSSSVFDSYAGGLGEATACRPIWIAALDRTFLEVHDWQQYAEMLSQWARSIDTFETTVKRISELPELVYFESNSDTSEINVPTS